MIDIQASVEKFSENLLLNNKTTIIDLLKATKDISKYIVNNLDYQEVFELCFQYTEMLDVVLEIILSSSNIHPRNILSVYLSVVQDAYNLCMQEHVLRNHKDILSVIINTVINVPNQIELEDIFIYFEECVIIRTYNNNKHLLSQFFSNIDNNLYRSCQMSIYNYIVDLKGQLSNGK